MRVDRGRAQLSADSRDFLRILPDIMEVTYRRKAQQTLASCSGRLRTCGTSIIITVSRSEKPSGVRLQKPRAPSPTASLRFYVVGGDTLTCYRAANRPGVPSRTACQSG